MLAVETSVAEESLELQWEAEQGFKIIDGKDTVEILEIGILILENLLEQQESEDLVSL